MFGRRPPSPGWLGADATGAIGLSALGTCHSDAFDASGAESAGVAAVRVDRG